MNRAKIDRLSELCPVVPQDVLPRSTTGPFKAALHRKGGRSPITPSGLQLVRFSMDSSWPPATST